MFVNYFTNLVEQINKGALPNLDNSYIYICRVKCNNAKAIAENDFDEKFTQTVELPTDDNYLNTTFDSALNSAKELYLQHAIGDEKDLIRDELEKQLRKKKEVKSKENENLTMTAIRK